MPRVAYIAHPVGDGEDRAKNIENVNKWFEWLFHHTDYALSVPWEIYVRHLDESHRARAMRDDLESLSRCDVIILTGGRISPGMATELQTARVLGIEIVDLTSVGYEPSDKAIPLIPDWALLVR